MAKRITVFTPTYNRAHLIERLYVSLINQTNKDFIWLVVDDGSADGTNRLVSNWIKVNKIQIAYHYKENGGMHTAHNMANQLIDTELSICIDSDDAMPPDAIEKILKIWDRYKYDECAGIIGTNADFDGNIMGSDLPHDLKYSTVVDLFCKYGVTGDKKLVYRADVKREVEPYPVFEGEKLVPLGYKYILIDMKYKMIVTNEILCNVEYQPNGSTNTILKQYFESPRGFAEARKVRMKYSPYLKDRFRCAIHYVSSSIIMNNKQFLEESPRRALTIIAIPFGFLLTVYLKYKVKEL